MLDRKKTAHHHKKPHQHNKTQTKKLVLIHADWCGHCQRLKPHWDQMKNKLNQHKHIEVVEISDADSNKDEKIAELNALLHPNSAKIEIAGFPTLKKIHGGMATEFNGENRNDVNSLLKWAHEDGRHKGGAKRGSRKTRKNKNTSRRRKLNTFLGFKW
jgi:thiol-disulfide isomerase/thioredoxin